MDISAHDTTIDDAKVKEEIESIIETSVDFMDTSSIEYQNEDTLATEMENKLVEFPVKNKQNLLSNDFLEPDVLECTVSTLESAVVMDSMERVNEICRICLANYFKGQSIFMIYKMKFLPHIVFNLTGNLPTRDDELPSMICFTCAELLLQAETARKKCISSDKFLRKELENKKNEMVPIEITDSQNGDSDQNIQPNENKFASVQISTTSNTSKKTSSVSITKEHNYINFGNRKKRTKEIRVKKIKGLQNEEELLNIIEKTPEEEESFNKTEYNPNIEEFSKEKTTNKTNISDENQNSEDNQNMEEESLLEAQYLDDTEIYNELFAVSNVQYEEDIELSIDNIDSDPLGMGIILPELFLCTVCSRKITSLRAFKRHQKYHNAENFRCPICPDVLTPETIRDHLFKHKERQELTCGDCGKQFDDITDLYTHIITHVQKYNRQVYDYMHECEVCYKKTPSLVSHLNHMKQEHDIDEDKPFKCDKCGMRFTAKQGLQRHVYNIHNQGRLNREKKFLCLTCGTKFFTKGNLQVHMRSHTGERPYKCKYCGKSFSQINGLMVHTYIHTGEKPFICNVCGKMFKQYSHFDYHMLVHADKRPHVCNICNRAFRVRGTLNTHMKIHGTRPFRCETCDKGYPERSGLKKHMKKIHGSDLNIPHKQEDELLEVIENNSIKSEDITQDEIQWFQAEAGWCSSSTFADVERLEEFCEKQKEVITSLEVVPLKYEIEEIPVEDMCNKDTISVRDKNPLIVEIMDTDDENSEHKTYVEDENIAQENSPPHHKMANCVEYIQGSCRVCLTNCFNGQSIFKFYKKKYLPNIILILTGIHVTKNDELPSMICFSCANLLLQADSIRNMCQSSDKFLKQQKEFKIKTESFDVDNSQHKEQSIKYPSINLDKDKNTNSPKKECLSVVKHLESNVFKEEIKSDNTEIKRYKSNEQISQDNYLDASLENHHHYDHNVERLEDDIEDNFEADSEDQHRDKERLQEIDEDQWSVQKNENEISKSSSDSDSYDEYNDNDASKIFECNICSKQFDEKKLFDRHQRTHIGNKIKCPICPKELRYRSMKLHLGTHKGITKLICDQCGDVFNNVLILFKHIRQHKTNVDGNSTYVYKCDICEKENFTLSAHQTHMKNMHGLEDPRPFKCKQCSMGFTRKQAMYRHVGNVHNQNPSKRVRDFLCNICGKNFYVKFHLEIHMRSHTGERPYKCKYCGKAFTQLSALKTHEYIHTGEKPFACKQCGKKFKQYGHLAYHQQTHAEGSPYVCKICDHKFKIKSNLNIHMKLHSKKQYSCKICQKAYVWPCKLKEHIRKSHHGIELSELEDNLEES